MFVVKLVPVKMLVVQMVSVAKKGINKMDVMEELEAGKENVSP